MSQLVHFDFLPLPCSSVVAVIGSCFFTKEGTARAGTAEGPGAKVDASLAALCALTFH